MSLPPGFRVGSYEVVAPIGRGGMGEVYRATDTKLHRHVALKVLPDALANDPDRRSRFEREAWTLASLNHPNIAHIYGFESAGEVHALAMELVEGPTLAEVIDGSGLEARPSTALRADGAGKSHGVPIADAVNIARQIAEALEAAHEHGVVHRDLKPANVKVTEDGAVKVLDFGLAKAVAPDDTSAAADFSNSPTLTSPTLTAMGVILGTAAYMAPEQARGGRVDRRADVWAFGCVLYEMLTGQRAFPGDTVSDTMAAVLRGEPDWSLLPAGTPPALQRVLRRCLVKDRKQRLGDMTAVRLDLTEPSSEFGRAVPPERTARVRIAGFAIAAIVGAALTGAVVWMLRAAPAPSTPVHLVLNLPPGETWMGNAGSGIVLSRDGRLVGFLAGDDQWRGLYVRPLDQDKAIRIKGSDNAYGPFFSPDSKEIGFFSGGKLWRAPVTGESSFPIAPVAEAARGAAWGADGFVYVGGEAGLTRVPVSGGAHEPITQTDRTQGEVAHRFPDPLPKGNAVIFNSLRAGLEDSRIQLVDLNSRQVRTLIDQSGHGAKYSSSGHLLFLRAGSLMAAPFDVSRLQVTGLVQPIIGDVAFNNGGAAHFSVSDTGTLAYVPGRQALTTRLVRLDRSGRTEPMALPPGGFVQIAVSGDGRRLALTRRTETGGSDIVIWDEERRSLTDVTRNPEAMNMNAVWLPGGESIVFSASPKGIGSPAYLFRVRTDGSTPPEKLSPTDIRAQFGSAGQVPASVSSDGADVFFHQTGTDDDGLFVLRVGAAKAEKILPDGSSGPQISPDGRRIVYRDRAGLWVQSYPILDGPRRPLSMAGTAAPRWSRDGRELFFRSGLSIMAAPADPRTGFPDGPTRKLFDVDELAGPLQVAPDGQHFYMLRALAVPVDIPHVVVNWFSLLTPPK